ncbi:PH domain-containing protein [Novilysobacter ciconiae]|nr:PH domain-containing protein [Lysobacter ciconiae]
MVPPFPETASTTAVDEPAWQPLPQRARALFLLGTTPWLALTGAVAGAALAVPGTMLLDSSAANALRMFIAFAVVGLVVGGGLGWLLGHKQFRHTYWRLDPEGLALRRGRMWLRETRVPITRVQHLDLKRGPLQRRRSLATLVVHTAGTRNSSVVVPNIDVDDAEFLRDRLGRQIDLDHDD